MASLFTSQTPATPDAADGSDSYSMGTYITPAVDGTFTAIRWYFPTGAQPGGEAVKANLFLNSDQSKIGGADASFASPGTPGSWNEVALTSPAHVLAGTMVCATIRTPNRYVATGSFSWPLTNGDLSTPSNAGRFTSGASGNVDFPASSFNDGCYFVDVVFVPDGAGPAEGSVDLGLGLAVSATGQALTQGVAALGLDLAVSATGQARSQGVSALALNLAVSATGERASQGVAALGLNLAVSATGERVSQGAAALGLNLAVSASGEHASHGAAALGLNLAVSASGSNGDAGCPVSPWPWTPGVASGYLWTPRAVKSFPGGDC